MLKPAIAYCRYSSDNQREESIDAQKRAIDDYAVRNGYDIIKYYVDEAKTATTDNREQFQQLFKDIKTRNYEALIIHKLDRFARDRYDSAIYKRKLKESGLILLSVLENLDGSPESIILESVLDGMAEYYSKNLSREVKKGMKETAYQGKHTGGVPPLGYGVDNDGFYYAIPEEAAIVKSIFEMYDLGNSYREMADRLNSKGLKTKAWKTKDGKIKPGKRFTKYSFHDLLINEKYKGVYVFNKTAGKDLNGVRNNHSYKDGSEIIRQAGGIPQIVDEALWERVNHKMRGNVRSGAKKAKRIYLLSGIIFCGACDSPMSGNTRNCGRNKDEYSTYDCNRRKREKTCMAKSVNKSLVESVVLNYLANEFFADKNIEYISLKFLEISNQMKSDADKELPQIKKELDDLLIEKEKIVDAMIKSGVSEWLNERALLARDRIEYLEGRVQYIEKKQETSSILDYDKIRNYLAKDKDIKNKSPEQQRAVIQTYVEKVIVHHSHVDINTIVDLNGEGEESRTPVRKHFHKTFSERS